MSLTYALTIGNNQYDAGPKGAASADVTTAQALVDTAQTDAVAMSTTATTSAIAAAQVVGAGDASVEIDAIDAAFVTLAALIVTAKASVAAIDLSSAAVTLPSGDIVFVIDTSVVSNMNKVKASLDAIHRCLDGSGLAKG